MAMTEEERKNITQDMFNPADLLSADKEKVTGKSISYWQDAFRRLRQNKAAIVCAVIIAFIVILALVGPYMNDKDAISQDLSAHYLPPRISFLTDVHWLPFDGLTQQGVDLYEQRGVDTNYWFGADKFGRDMWSRVWQGTQASLLIGLVAALADFIIGIAYGGISGYFGGRTDDFMQRVVEILVGIPQMILLILLIMVMEPSLYTIIAAIAFTGWVGQSRIVRGQIMKLKSQEFVLASRTLGAKPSRLISKHLLPNTVGQIIITTMFSVPAAIFAEAFLSFIGLGVQPPKASLGTLINDGFDVMQIHPYMALFPAIVISLLLICFNVFGDGLRDALDPKLRQ
ncbi:MAG TPA: oligopeptide ABC transporter permease [Bacillales bacterium]|nr:oligopeptide ABC transporter permease [Bacillales bacterium]